MRQYRRTRAVREYREYREYAGRMLSRIHEDGQHKYSPRSERGPVGRDRSAMGMTTRKSNTPSVVTTILPS